MCVLLYPNTLPLLLVVPCTFIGRSYIVVNMLQVDTVVVLCIQVSAEQTLFSPRPILPHGRRQAYLRVGVCLIIALSRYTPGLNHVAELEPQARNGRMTETPSCAGRE